jgi:hypothetical protein
MTQENGVVTKRKGVRLMVRAYACTVDCLGVRLNAADRQFQRMSISNHWEVIIFEGGAYTITVNGM